MVMEKTVSGDNTDSLLAVPTTRVRSLGNFSESDQARDEKAPLLTRGVRRQGEIRRLMYSLIFSFSEIYTSIYYPQIDTILSLFVSIATFKSKIH